MTTLLSYESLRKLLPMSGAAFQTDADSPASRHIYPTADRPDDFIPPDFAIECASEISTTPQVILISAPAAVGKSWLARDLSASSGNPLWDLSHFSVGSGFFAGTVTEVYGADQFAAFVSALRSGDTCLILDAADEALVRAGTGNYEAAIENLARLVGTDLAAHASVVILGRHDTIQDTEMILDRLNVHSRVVEVDFFSEAKARQFVRAKARGQSKFAVVKELDAFLDQFIFDVQAALGADVWSSSKTFLGYAPVLDALAAFSKIEENPLKKLNEIKKSGRKGHVWDLLVEIIGTIASRESDKFANNFGGDDEKKRKFGRAADDTTTQVRMLLADNPSTVTPAIPNDGDDDWLNDIEDQVRQQYRMHPFLRSSDDDLENPLLRFTNAAFRDYCLAQAFRADQADDAPRLASHWQHSLVNPSPMFSRFIFSSNLRPSTPIHADALGVIADSHAATFRQTDMTLWVDSSTEPDLVELMLFSPQEAYESIELRVVDSKVRFFRALSHATVFCPDFSVVAGSGAVDFVLGPRAIVYCDQFEAESTELRILGQTNSVLMLAKRFLGSARRVVGSSDSLKVQQLEGSASYPWHQYVEKSDGLVTTSKGELHLAGMQLRKLVLWFSRPSMTSGGLSYPRNAMDTILNKGRAPREIFDFCEAQGVLTRKGSSYVLDLGISLPAITQNDISNPELRDFLETFVVWSK